MITTNIAEAAIGISEAQAFARIETGEEDALLAALVRTASALCECFTGLLADASDGLIDCDDPRPIPGFAAHGSSIGDALHGLVDLAGVELFDENGRLASPGATPVTLVAAQELGCDSDDDARPMTEQVRAPNVDRPAALSLGYYDPDRDYQAGQMRSSGGGSGSRDERIELPVVLAAAQARLFAEGAYARRWRSGDRVKLRLPPSQMGLRPGQAIRLASVTRSWVVRSVSIEGMAVAVEAEDAPVAVPALPAAPGRAVSEPDIGIGRTELALIELPPMGDAPEASATLYLAASNAGLWKPVAVELTNGVDPAGSVAMTRRAVIGMAESLLDARSPPIFDEVSSVIIRLANGGQYLLNADDDALMAGANLAILGDELLQFGRAEQVGAGLYRLSHLLRGRRGTEWASATHAVGDRFCLIDVAAMKPVTLPPGSVGTALTATAHGIGDIAPLPVVERLIRGESLRPPSPSHLTLRRDGTSLVASWTRRSHRGWAWIDGVGVPDDPFPETYRLNLTGTGGTLTSESADCSAAFGLAELPGKAGEAIAMAVSIVGPAALSHPATASIIL
ncbi:phage tail protein [Sphingomonas sp. RB56-2]|uniref:Phage tail protein n=1 Tax=Sphingomonas brevis TaxID=2908206 RepID=A0ABT0S670_9SPHN|nr:phage tail protein [Sphingomonas brevis]MCL6739884.1 phage tail protein [Sphingomonas brevis]